MIGLSAGKIAPGVRGPWWPQGARYAADFVTNRYMVDGIEIPATEALSFSRASTKLAPDSAGVYHAFAANEMAHTDRGLWLEPESTNHVRNNTNVGAVSGTATLPNYWSLITSAGLSREVVGLGTVGGIPYMDLRLYGTANTAGPCQVACETASFAPAATGETWVISAFLQALSMGSPPSSVRLRLREDGVGGINLLVREAIIAPSAEFNRFSASFALNHASTTFVRPALAFGVSNGTAYDFTIRIGLVSLERQQTESTPIPTIGAVGTRALDSLTFALPTGSYNTTYDFEVGVIQSAAHPGGIISPPTHLSPPLRSIVVMSTS